MKKLLLTLALVLASTAAYAQAPVATGASKFAWDQPAPDVATAQAYTYKYYADNAATGVVLTPIACTTVSTVFTCTVPIPAFTPGVHSVTVTAANAAGESAKSASLSFQMIVQPLAPLNLRLAFLVNPDGTLRLIGQV